MSSEPQKVPVETVGVLASAISVEISTRFLEQFSEQLYSSPQKAFEELISNSWDAGANSVEIEIPDDLTSPDAIITILDNGASMDEDGLKDLWHIAFSPKRDNRVQHGRKMVGKFGIGKLATYILADRLTYLCKSEDGKIRRVTMDYGKVASLPNPEMLMSNLSLDLYEVPESELETALGKTKYAHSAQSLIDKGFNLADQSDDDDNEFNAPKSNLSREASATWTLVILSGLKPAGTELKPGVLRRMLRAALPLSSEMVIQLNSEKLSSTKLESVLASEWNIGPDLKFSDIEVPIPEPTEDGEKVRRIPITSSNDEYPYVEIPGIGRITGTIKLYQDKISGGKSEDRGVSNGFFVNVLGRIINQNDPSFGEENLSHAAWSRFRLAVRADGLDKHLTTSREQFQNQNEVIVFKAFLRKAFNYARTIYDADTGVELSDGGDVLVKSLGVLSLAPLRSAVSQTLKSQPPLPGLFDESGIDDREAKWDEWRKDTGDNIRNALSKVKFENTNDDSFTKFRIHDNSIVINKKHPFVAEHSRTKAEKELLRTIGMVNLLSDIYALENGIEPEKLSQVRDFRDRLMQFRAYQQRKSAANIIGILLKVQNKSDSSKELETIVGNALEYLGFEVEVKGQSGEPEGIARAMSLSEAWTPTEAEQSKPFYSFTYDAKTAASGKAKTGNLSLDAVNEHRKRYKADYALVVAPGYEEGASDTRAEDLKITLMTASDLGRLLELTAECGALPLDRLEKIFTQYKSKSVSAKIDELAVDVRKSRKFTIDIFLRALEILKGKLPDLVHPSAIVLISRTVLDINEVTERDVEAVVRGLSIIVPDLVGFDEAAKKIVVNASSEKVTEAVAVQFEKFRNLEAETSTLAI